MAVKYVFYKRENKFRKTFEKMEGFSFVTPVTGLNTPNTGKKERKKKKMMMKYLF
jgi:hypothetical protein